MNPLRLMAGVCLVSILTWAEDVPSLRIPRVSRAPKLEDFLHNTPREAEARIDDFRQSEPGDGVPVSQSTTAYLSYDDRYLYAVFVCRDERDKVRAHMAKREDIVTDDRVGINIDTFHDHQHAYWFEINPFGLQMDGQDQDMNFDAVWRSEGRVTPGGYIAMIAIPFRSIRFPNAPEQTWGIGVCRMIQRNNEVSCWPYITRRVAGFTNQMGHLEGIERISPARNLQFIPYGQFASSSFLDRAGGGPPRFRSDREARAGLDAKMVLRDSLALDVTANPDFSQVEADEPQVTVNQRYEVVFPEKRPFFLENANSFVSPEDLFFSRRIVDPQFGARVTGKLGRWNLGALLADDRAPGQVVARTDPGYGERALAGVVRLQREVGKDSYVGMLSTGRRFGATSNSVFAMDTSLKASANLSFTGQAIHSSTRDDRGGRTEGQAFVAGINWIGRHLNAKSRYTDRSRGFRADLGYIPRVDIREFSQSAGYRWRPRERGIISFGPEVSASLNRDHQGRLQDWQLTPRFVIEFPRLSILSTERQESFEFYAGRGFRQEYSRAKAATEWLRWLALSAAYGRGTRINYRPGASRSPFLAAKEDGSLAITLRPNSRIRLTQTYVYGRLSVRSEDSAGAAPPVIFNNHLLRSKLNYQFTRELSLRSILDYNAVLPNASLVSQERAKRIGGDLLLTYLLHPGTALHAGYTGLFENLALDPTTPPYLLRTGFPGTPVGRQVFVKLSYVLRY